MYRGELPGFHWDSDRGKYFQIQANHNVAAGAGKKHTFESVQRERNLKKKRKTEADAETKRRQQTVKRSRLFSSPLTYHGGLSRELGQPNRANAESRDVAYVSQLAKNRTVDKTNHLSFLERDEKLKFLHHLPALNRRLLVLDAPTADFCCAITDKTTSEGYDTKDIAGFKNTISGVAVSRTPDYSTNVMMCSNRPGYSGTLHYSVMLDDGETINSTNTTVHSVAVILGINPPREISLWTCAINPSADYSAIGTTEGVLLSDMTILRPTDLLTSWSSYRALDWLSPNLLAAGQSTLAGDSCLLSRNGRQPLNGPAGAIFLYDVRAQDVALRFQDQAAITGLKAANDSQQQLLVSTNTTISLYDTRHVKTKAPLYSIAHNSQGPELPLAIDHGGGLVAAPDANQQVQIYSLRSGQHLSALKTDPRNTDNITQLNFRCDQLGRPCLEACQGRDLVRFGWDSGEDDEV